MRALSEKRGVSQASVADPWACLSTFSSRDSNLPKIDLHKADLTEPTSVEKVFESYKSQGGIWGVVHVAVRPSHPSSTPPPPPSLPPCPSAVGRSPQRSSSASVGLAYLPHRARKAETRRVAPRKPVSTAVLLC